MQSTPTAANTRLRRKIVAVIGDNNLDTATLEASMVAGDEAKKQQLAEQVGRASIDAGHRVLTGGLAGVMDAAMKGARSSTEYREGDTIAILPTDDPSTASPHADIVICTGLGSYRNGIVGRADAVIAIGGGAGTVQEVCTAWKAKRPVVVLQGVSGFTAGLAGQRIDNRDGADRRPISGAGSAEEAVNLVTYM